MMYYTLKPQGDIILSSLKWLLVKYPLTAMRKVTDAQQNTQRQEPGDKGVGTQQAVSRQHQLTSTKGHGISKLSPIPGVRYPGHQQVCTNVSPTAMITEAAAEAAN